MTKDRPASATAKGSITIAVVDDHPAVAKTVAGYLKPMGCERHTYTDPLDLIAALDDVTYDIVITDIEMPHLNGIELLQQVREMSPTTDVIVMSAHAEKSHAIAALKHGAYDFFEKPVERHELNATVQRTVSYRKLRKERDGLAERLSLVSEEESRKWGINALVGKSACMQDIIRRLRLLQKSQKTNALILGESGTGKELVARAIHYGSPRAEGPFVAVNCAAIPEDLADSILFGHAKGSFTGATADRKGSFEQADGGTLFLDEIGDMPRRIQTKLLRVLEDSHVVPVGEAQGRNVDVRVVSATNTAIEEQIEAGAFRADLFHRLAAYEISLPPLRDRKDDLPLLTEHFATQLAAEMGIPTPHISKAAVTALALHSFPGNVRELRNIIERALIDCDGDTLEPEHLYFRNSRSEAGGSELLSGQTSPPPATASEAQSLQDVPFNLDKAQVLLAHRALDHARGNISEAARLLGISRSRIYRLLA